MVTLQMMISAARTTSLASMFLLTAVCAGCAAVIAQNFTFGIFVTVVSLLACARTSLFALYSKADGVKVGWLRKLENLGANLILVAFFLMALMVCFVPICLAVTIVTKNLILASWLSLLISLVGLMWLLWLVPTYPRK